MKLESPPRFTSFYESFSDLIFATMAIFVLLMTVFLILVRSSEGKDELESQLEQIKEVVSQLESERDSDREKLEELKKEAESCREKLKKRFLLVSISWTGVNDDIDLYVEDPKGRKYNFTNRKFPGSSAELEVDSTKGPGNEMWLHPEVEPGDYKIYYNYYAKRSQGARVRGLVVYPDGKYRFPEQKMTINGEMRFIGTVNVTADGSISIINTR